MYTTNGAYSTLFVLLVLVHDFVEADHQCCHKRCVDSWGNCDVVLQVNSIPDLTHSLLVGHHVVHGNELPGDGRERCAVRQGDVGSCAKHVAMKLHGVLLLVGTNPRRFQFRPGWMSAEVTVHSPLHFFLTVRTLRPWAPSHVMVLVIAMRASDML